MEPLVDNKKGPAFDSETGLAVPVTAIWMVFLTIFMDTLAATISTPALPYYARQFGASNADIGYLFAAWSLTSTFCAPILGRLSDRIGRRSILLVSLVGAGVANIGQALAQSYWQLLIWRGFSGVWAAVGSSAQVYMTDVCSPAKLSDYMSRLSSVPGAAMTFGPGLGGGLSTFGLGVPVMVDGCLSFAAGVLVFYYLPESPSWLQARQQATDSTTSLQGPDKRTPIPMKVYVLGISCFLWGVSFGTRVSMTVVSLHAKLGLDALQVGYVYVVFAISMLCQNIWITPVLQNRLGLYTVAIFGMLISAAFSITGFAFVQQMWPCLLCQALANAGGAARMASGGPISAMFTDGTNRGAVFAQIQMMTNFGRMVGPIVAGHIAVYDPVRLPWVVAGLCSTASAIILAMLRPTISSPLGVGAQPIMTPTIIRTLGDFTDLRETPEELKCEMGNQEDYERVGRFVGDLLTKRNYRWVSKQDSVLKMLEELLPQLSLTGEQQFQDLERLASHVQVMQKDFAKLGDREM